MEIPSAAPPRVRSVAIAPSLRTVRLLIMNPGAAPERLAHRSALRAAGGDGRGALLLAGGDVVGSMEGELMERFQIPRSTAPSSGQKFASEERLENTDVTCSRQGASR